MAEEEAAKNTQKVEETKETVKEEAKKTEKKKSGGIKKFFKWLFISLGVVLVVIVLYLGWLGFVPGLSNILGANNPKDLGVTYTEADLDSYYEVTKSEDRNYDNAPQDKPGHKVIFAEPKPLDIEVTQEEITARINETDWVYMPVYNAQVRFGDNNRIEVSANLDTDVIANFVSFIGGVGYSNEDVQTGIDWLNRMAGDPAIYIDSTGSITNNVLDLTINSVTIGRWSAPLDEATKVLTTGTINALAGTVGLDVDSATFSEGMLDFDGAGPTIIYVKGN